MEMNIQRIDDDARRVMRDIARQRQDSARLRDALAATGATLSQQNRTTAADEGAPTTEQRMLRTIAAELSRLSLPESQQETQSVLPDATALDLEIIAHDIETGSASALSDAQVVRIVKAAVAQNRIDLFTQPIVTLPQRKARFVEALARIRIRPGLHMPAERYIGVARAQNLLPVIDNLLLLESLKALRAASESDAGLAYFCNITSLTLHDPKFMTDLVEFIAQNRVLAQRLVFELTQHDLATMSHDVVPVLSGLARLGCRFSLDQVSDLALQPAELSARHIRFIKIDAGVLIAALRKPGGAQRLQRLRASLDREGIDMIAARIEKDRQLVELLDLGIDYGQGYLFGHPHLHFAESEAQ